MEVSVRFTILLGVVAATWASTGGQSQQSASANRGTLTIDQLIDIKHPSNPVWSRDSRRIAFVWDRAGVQNLFVVPMDGSAKPVALTTDGQSVTNVFWSHDSRTLYFIHGATLMKSTVDEK